MGVSPHTTQCHGCGATTDVLRGHPRIIGGVVRTYCSGCAVRTVAHSNDDAAGEVGRSGQTRSTNATTSVGGQARGATARRRHLVALIALAMVVIGSAVLAAIQVFAPDRLGPVLGAAAGGITPVATE